PYPIKKALALVEAISRDLNDVLQKILCGRRLMYMEYNDFEKVMSGAEDVFRTWDEMIREFTNVARDVMRKNSYKFVPIKINPAHDKLQERVAFVRNFRRQHEQLYQTIVKIMIQPKNAAKIVIEGEESFSIDDINSIKEVKVAYESVKDIDVLEVSIEGTEIWFQAENAYFERVSRVENQIIESLRDRLSTCKNANEMFGAFSKFNALFARPKIRGVIQEYQNELIDRVKKDISKLHERFDQQYHKSEANYMFQLRDIPAISGAMIWARQIERQLQRYMKRVEDVLGKGWEMYAEGHKLQIECNNFKKKLDTRLFYEFWQKDILQRSDLNMTGRLLEITRDRAQGNILQLGVNFDPQIITIFREVRNLLWLGHHVPHNISTSAKVAKRVYPFVISLIETVKKYAQTVRKIQKHPDIIMLVANYRNGIQAMITKSITFEWEYFVYSYDDSPENQHVTFVREFANTVLEFQDKITHLKSYSNIDVWIAQLDKRIETVLSQRLQRAIFSWTTEFISSSNNSTNIESIETSADKGIKNVRHETVRNDSSDGETPTTAKTEKPVFQQFVHAVLIKNQVIYLDPPIEVARTRWYIQLHEWFSVVCNLPRIQGLRSDIGQARGSTVSRETNTYSNLLTKLPDGSLEKAYEVIEANLNKIQAQSLWNLESNYIYERLGDDFNKWKRVLLEIKKTRATFDNSDIELSFGIVVINYKQAQSKVNAKYDQWQRYVLAKFGIKLGDSMQEFRSGVSNSRKELENKSMESNNTSAVVAFITFVQDLKCKVNKWQQDVEIFREGQKTLERYQYQFPSGWLHIGQVEGEWSAFKEILDKKSSQIQDQIAKEALNMYLNVDCRLYPILEEIRDLRSIWSSLSEVLQSINELKEIQWYSVVTTQENLRKLEKLFISINELPDNIHKVSVLIYAVLSIFLPSIYELKETPQSSVVPREIRRQLKNLNFLEMLPSYIRLSSTFGVLINEVLSILWPSLNELKKTPWSLVLPRKIRRQLENILNDIKELPSSIQAFEVLVDRVKTYIKINPILSELKSEALKDRHWEQLFKALKLDNCFSLSEMTVGHVWDLDLKKNAKIIKNIVAQASGEEN
ncbi:12469_t:CDS:2, partial [Dentiscutata erythropus]